MHATQGRIRFPFPELSPCGCINTEKQQQQQNKTKHTKKPGKPFLVDSLRQATCVCVLSTVYALCCCQHRQGMPRCLGQGEETEAQWGWLPGSPPTGAPRRLLDASGTEACLALCLPHACQFDLRIFTFLLSQ